MLPNDEVLRFYVLGRVQGVGFRRWAVREAAALGLIGWIRNRYDGRVEIAVKGADEALQKFMAQCRKGPLFAKVLELDFNVSNEDMPTIPENGFIKIDNF